MQLQSRNTKYTEGQAAAQAVISAQGKSAALAQLEQVLPAGQPCELDLEQWRYWTGWRQAVESAQ